MNNTMQIWVDLHQRQARTLWRRKQTGKVEKDPVAVPLQKRPEIKAIDEYPYVIDRTDYSRSIPEGKGTLLTFLGILYQAVLRFWIRKFFLTSLIRTRNYSYGSGSGSLHQQAKPWFLLFYDFLINCYLWRLESICLKVQEIGKRNCFLLRSWAH